MALSKVCRGFFDPIVEFMRPIPPLALIPLSIIWLGIGNVSKIFLLFLAALWVMVLAARAGVLGIRLSKIHAAYTLGASKKQVLLKVILPNALPEIFTGMRVAMGVCWGTLVAAELVGADAGVGFMITVAGKFLETGLVFVGIIMIGRDRRRHRCRHAQTAGDAGALAGQSLKPPPPATRAERPWNS